MEATLTRITGAMPTALTALLVYRRPAPRRQILAQLADLGVFVVEHPGGDGCVELAGSAGADVAIVLAGPDLADIQLVRDLARRPTRSVIVSVASVVAARAFLDAGAIACIQDSELEVALGPVVANAANRARAARIARPASDALRFGDVSFDPAVPALWRGGRSRTLSRSEKAVLLRLLSAAGRPVDAQELERVAAPQDGSVRPGFLKAVVLRLRRKIEDLGGDSDALRTIRGFGYVLASSRPVEA
jgi:DNA-binding response OmpR family regulator